MHHYRIGYLVDAKVYFETWFLKLNIMLISNLITIDDECDVDIDDEKMVMLLRMRKLNVMKLMTMMMMIEMLMMKVMMMIANLKKYKKVKLNLNEFVMKMTRQK